MPSPTTATARSASSPHRTRATSRRSASSKARRTGITGPMGVAFDVKNNEIWVANYGDHTALVFARTRERQRRAQAHRPQCAGGITNRRLRQSGRRRLRLEARRDPRPQLSQRAENLGVCQAGKRKRETDTGDCRGRPRASAGRCTGSSTTRRMTRWSCRSRWAARCSTLPGGANGGDAAAARPAGPATGLVAAGHAVRRRRARRDDRRFRRRQRARLPADRAGRRAADPEAWRPEDADPATSTA